jgi:hypothetical protein
MEVEGGDVKEGDVDKVLQKLPFKYRILKDESPHNFVGLAKSNFTFTTNKGSTCS